MIRARSYVKYCLLLLVIQSTCLLAFASTHHLTLIHINDTHGRLLHAEPNDGPEVGGMARTATIVRQIRKENPRNTLFLHAGDLISRGDPLTIHTLGLAGFTALNRMRLDAFTAGNGDFYDGVDNLLRCRDAVSFPILHGNTRLRSTGQALLDAVTILQVDGLKIGVFGVGEVKTGHPSAANLLYEDPIEAARSIVEDLIPRVDLIIALTHIGYEKDLLLAKEISDIDIVVGGHTHTVVPEPTRVERAGREPAYVVQAGDYTRWVGRLDLMVEKDRDTTYVSSAKGSLIPLTEEVAEDPSMKRWLHRQAKPLRKRICVSTEEIPHIPGAASPMGTLVADIIRDATGSDITFLESDVVVRGMDKGVVRLEDIYRINPWRSPIIMMQLTGAQVSNIAANKEHLVSGCMVASDAGNMVYVGTGANHADWFSLTGEPAKSGQPIDPLASYTVSMTVFMHNSLPELAEVPYTPTQYCVDSALIDWLSRHF